MTLDLFVGFCVGDLNEKVVSIRQINHIKSLFINMLHEISNLIYSMHLRITNCVYLKPFILTINLNVL